MREDMMVLLKLLLVWNVVVMMLYGYDKLQAIRQKWRVSEAFLLTVTILGGGFGAWFGIRLWHHKTKKWYFRASFCLGIGLTVLVLVFFW